ncbi:MAG: DUF120 domain-containing protein [Candidatus Anstonellaceae archaeon]
MKIIGAIKKGLGEGKKFMSLKKYREQFYKILKYYPYRGTLNVELDKENLKKFKYRVQKKRKYLLRGFRQKNRTYREVKLIKAKFRDKKIGIIFPYYRHNPENIIEIVARQNLRYTYKLKDGDIVEVEI